MSDQMSMAATMRSTPGGLHLTISDRPDADRFEAQLDGQVVGWQPYRRYQGHIVLLLTEVAEAWRERGISSALIDGVLEFSRGQGHCRSALQGHCGLHSAPSRTSGFGPRAVSLAAAAHFAA
jgi:GNAT superfamily N-acetyltransferase